MKKLRANSRGDSYYPMNHYIPLEGNMRKTIFVSLITLILGVGFLAYAQSKPENNAAGNWSGAWTGGSTGKFEMTITKGADGKLSGTLTTHPDQGEGSTVNLKL